MIQSLMVAFGSRDVESRLGQLPAIYSNVYVTIYLETILATTIALGRTEIEQRKRVIHCEITS